MSTKDNKPTSRDHVFDNAPIVDVRWIADQLGVTPSAVRRYLAADGPEPRLVSDVHGLHDYAFTRAAAETWIAAYRATPGRGRGRKSAKQAKIIEYDKIEAEIKRLEHNYDEFKEVAKLSDSSTQEIEDARRSMKAIDKRIERLRHEQDELESKS